MIPFAHVLVETLSIIYAQVIKLHDNTANLPWYLVS